MQNYNHALPQFREKRRYELHEGEIYFMAVPGKNHSEIVGNLLAIFKDYLKGSKKCRVYGENMNVIFEKNERQYLPDLKIVCNTEIIKDDGIYGAPDLIVEVLSPRTAKNDLGYKKDMYEKYGVREYWIINPDERSIQVYLLRKLDINGHDAGYKYELTDVYMLHRSEADLIDFDEEDKSAIAYEFKTSLYDDLIIRLEDVFENVD